MMFPSSPREASRGFRCAFVICLLSALAACSGGGGNGGGGSSSSSPSAPDTTPNAFSFPAVTDAEPGSEHISEPATVTGISVPVPVTIQGGEYSIGDGEFTSAASEIGRNQQLRVKATAPDAVDSSHEVKVTVGEGEGARSATFTITTLDDTTAPEAAIVFPPPMSATDKTSLTIRGTAEDDYSKIAKVTLIVTTEDLETQFDVTSEDEFATWSAPITLSQDAVHSIKAVVTDAEDNETETLVTVHQQPFDLPFPDNAVPISRVRGLAYHSSQATVFVTDGELLLDALIAINLEDGSRRVISGRGIANEDENMAGPVAVMKDPIRNVCYVGMAARQSIFKVDIETGEKTLFSGDSYPSDTQPSIGVPVAIVEGPGHESAVYVVDADAENITRLDLATGRRTLVSDASTPGEPFAEPVDLFVLDENVGLVADRYRQQVLRVNLETGERTVFFEGAAGDQAYPMSITGVRSTGRLFLADSQSGIYELDPSGQSRTLIHGNLPSTSYRVDKHVRMGPRDEYLFWLDQSTAGLYAVDIRTSEMVVISRSMADPD